MVHTFAPPPEPAPSASGPPTASLRARIQPSLQVYEEASCQNISKILLGATKRTSPDDDHVELRVLRHRRQQLVSFFRTPRTPPPPLDVLQDSDEGVAEREERARGEEAEREAVGW